MATDKTKLFIATALLKGLKNDLENRWVYCEECEFTKKYVDYALQTLDELDKEE